MDVVRRVPHGDKSEEQDDEGRDPEDREQEREGGRVEDSDKAERLLKGRVEGRRLSRSETLAGRAGPTGGKQMMAEPDRLEELQAGLRVNEIVS